MSEIVRTVKLRLDMPLDVARRTVDAWTNACNAVSRIAFENGGISNAVRLQALAYSEAKACGLSAQVAVSCIHHVASKYAAMRANKARAKGPCVFKAQAVVLQGWRPRPRCSALP